MTTRLLWFVVGFLFSVPVDLDAQGVAIIEIENVQLARSLAAVVHDPEQNGPGILTARDILISVAEGQGAATERVADHLTADLVFASPEWSLEEAAVAMVRGGFRHLIVVDGGDIAGVVSMRDIVRCWTEDGSICEVPDSEAA